MTAPPGERRGDAPVNAERIALALACDHAGCGCGKRQGKGWQTHCPAHNDAAPSLNVADGEDGKLLLHDFGGCSQEAVIAALRERGLWRTASHRRRSRRIAAAYDYRDENGGLLYQAVRYEPKAFNQRRPDGKGGWIWNLDGVRRVPYRLPELLAADPAQWVFKPEGEKDADSLAHLGLVATTNSEGAGTGKWRDELSPYLKGRKVAILPDNDDEGRNHAREVAAKLAPYAAEVRIVELPDLPPKGDVSNWLAQGHTTDELLELVEAASPWESDTEPPDLAALLGDVVAFIRRYVVLSEAQADAAALWIVHTHALDAAETTPYLSITSPEKRSGKSLFLEVLSLPAARPWLTSRVSAAVLIRKVAGQKPTLLLDETDAAFRGEKDYAEALRAVLNAGHRRGGVTSLCVKKGADFELVDFPVFGAKAIAGIGRLPDTVADRSIPIRMKRRAPNETVARFRWRQARQEAEPIGEGLRLWAAANARLLQDARPDLPPQLDDRAADGWEPLLAIADAAGGDWPRRAHRAALALSVGDATDADSLGVRLLQDIRAVFDERHENRLPSADIVAALVALEESPWGDLKGKPLDPRALAWRLRPYGIRPHVMRVDDATPRGYVRADFDDAWGRYSPIPVLSATSATSATKQQPEYNTDGQNVADVADVAVYTGVLAPPTDGPVSPLPDAEDDTIPPEFTGKRHYVVALGLELSFPNVTWSGGGIPAGRYYYEQAARFFTDADIEKAVAALEARAAERRGCDAS